LKPERWGSPLVQEKYQEERACDKGHIIIIIMYWNRSILTEKTIPFNLPDITFMNKKTKNNFLIDTAVSNTHNLAKSRYQELANEICAMWKQKAAQAIPIVISSTAVIPKSLSQSLTRLKLPPQ